MRINTRKKKAASKYCCNILKIKRRERNVSVREIAKRVGLPLWLYWYLENHIQYMAGDMLCVIFDALDVNYTRGQPMIKRKSRRKKDMNKERIKRIEKIRQSSEELITELECIKDEESNAYNILHENLQRNEEGIQMYENIIILEDIVREIDNQLTELAKVK